MKDQVTYINNTGELEIETGMGVVRFTMPVAYQEIDGKKEYVPVAYHPEQESYGFAIGKYDKTRPLIIDPLIASTFIGGNDQDDILGMVLDSSGNVYIGG